MSNSKVHLNSGTLQLLFYNRKIYNLSWKTCRYSESAQIGLALNIAQLRKTYKLNSLYQLW